MPESLTRNVLGEFLTIPRASYRGRKGGNPSSKTKQSDRMCSKKTNSDYSLRGLTWYDDMLAFPVPFHADKKQNVPYKNLFYSHLVTPGTPEAF